MSNLGKIIKNIFGIVIIVAAIAITVAVYQRYNYNDFNKNVRERDKTIFSRDSEIKYAEADSYKIENQDYNDAMFSEKVTVTPNTPYKVTCKVKVENVENQDNVRTGGAHICIDGTTERSVTISGTSDWQEITLLFNSKNRTEIGIGFRLGGYQEMSKGTAWFSDFKMEVGTASNDTNWNMVCFIFPNIDVDVDINGRTEHVSLQMTENDIRDVQTNLGRFQTSIEEISHGKMTVEYETYIIDEPIDTLSYDEDNGYYVSDIDVYNQINPYVEQKEYDHIYVAFRMADKQKGNDVLVNDWIGLGGMDYFGIGFSNIRMPDDENNYAYQYHYLFNTFPEEVFIHEFLHTLERNAGELGYEVPALHNYARYGYAEDRLEGLREWYEDYMNQNISYGGEKIGLPAEIYSYQPVHESNFTYSTQIDAFHEPENIIEVIRSLFDRVGRLFSYDREQVA